MITWIEPLNNITSNDILFLDKGTHQGSYAQNHSPSMKKILYVENEGGEDYAMVELQSHEHSHMILLMLIILQQLDMLIC